MATDEERELVTALTSWGRRQKALARERDPLVRRALAAGVSKEAIHQFMGIGRTTIDRIQAGKGNDDDTAAEVKVRALPQVDQHAAERHVVPRPQREYVMQPRLRIGQPSAASGPESTGTKG